LQELVADGGDGVGFALGGFPLGGVSRRAWVDAVGEIVQCIGSALAGSG